MPKHEMLIVGDEHHSDLLHKLHKPFAEELELHYATSVKQALEKLERERPHVLVVFDHDYEDGKAHDITLSSLPKPPKSRSYYVTDRRHSRPEKQAKIVESFQILQQPVRTFTLKEKIREAVEELKKEDLPVEERVGNVLRETMELYARLKKGKLD